MIMLWNQEQRNIQKLKFITSKCQTLEAKIKEQSSLDINNKRIFRLTLGIRRNQGKPIPLKTRASKAYKKFWWLSTQNIV